MSPGAASPGHAHWPGQKLRASFPPGFTNSISHATNHHDRGGGKCEAEPVHELPVNAILKRADYRPDRHRDRTGRAGALPAVRAGASPETAREHRAGGDGSALPLRVRVPAAHRPSTGRRKPSLPPPAQSSARAAGSGRRTRPVPGIVVDVVVDRDVGLKQVVQVQVVRVPHHQPAPLTQWLRLPPLRIALATSLIPSRGSPSSTRLADTSCRSHDLGPNGRSPQAFDQG